MTSNITPITNASNTGADTSTAGEYKPREHGMAVVRDREAKALISLGLDTISEAHSMGHDLHAAIYHPEEGVSNVALQQMLADVLACVERAEHYLLLLGSTFEEQAPSPSEEEDGDPWASP